MDIFKPIQTFANLTTYNWLNITEHSYLGDTVNFFIYDLIKIGLLLVVINYFMAVVRYYFPMKKVKNILTKRRWFGLDYLFAALLGVVTPFCSCSSIPLFIGFLSAGIPIGITFTFLIASPLINEASLYLFPTMFGIKITILYNLIGIIVSMLGGVIIQRLNMKRFVNKEILKFKSKTAVEKENKGESASLLKLLKYWWIDGFAITKTVFLYVVLGVGLGALIHGFVPTSFVEKYLAIKAWWTVPLATLLGAPLYANSVSVIPVMEALVKKGIPLGTVLAFMTSIVTISIPEGLILKKVMKWPLLIMFFAITLIGIIFMGYFFNFVH